MPQDEFERLKIIVDGRVAELRLTRPDMMNRFDAQLHQEFTHALIEIRAMQEIRAIVLTADGRYFSAGGDFSLIRACHADMATRIEAADQGRLIVRTMSDMPIPIVCALTGGAIGLGATIVLLSDIIVSAPGVTLCDPHVSMGMVAGDGGCLVWPSAAGILRAKRHLLTGDPLPAELAYQFGLVTDLVDEIGEVEGAAKAIAAKIAALPPLAVQGTKRTLNAITHSLATQVIDLGFTQEMITMGSNDLIEAVNAFQEKRTPEYRGN